MYFPCVNMSGKVCFPETSRILSARLYPVQTLHTTLVTVNASYKMLYITMI